MANSSKTRFVQLLIALVLSSHFVGCATVLSEKRYPVTVENGPGSTYFSVHDRKNRVIHQGVTPEQVTLDAKAFPFWPAKYSVVFAGENAASEVRPVKAGFDPWVTGNLLLGGVPGFAIDGATGAMFKLPKSVHGNVPMQFAVTDPYHGSQIVKAALGSPAVGEMAAGGDTMVAQRSSSNATMIARAPQSQDPGDAGVRKPEVRVASAAERTPSR